MDCVTVVTLRVFACVPVTQFILFYVIDLVVKCLTVQFYFMAKCNPWVYLVIVNHCPFACYTAAWRCVVALRVLLNEGFSSKDFKVVRYRLEREQSIDVERDVVTDSFLNSIYYGKA